MSHKHGSEVIKSQGLIHANEENLQEVAFSWMCECGAYKSLCSQCQQYAAIGDERVVYRFTFDIDISELIEFSSTLGNMALNQPRRVTEMFQEVCYIAIKTLSWIPQLVSPSQVVVTVRFSSLPSLPEYQMSNNASFIPHRVRPKILQLNGIVCTISTRAQYTQTARFYCPESDCVGSGKYTYVRIHVEGKSESATVRNNFQCKYCGSTLVEDVMCRLLSDDLLALLEMGSAFSFVVSISYEIKETLEQTFLTPILEVNNIEKVNVCTTQIDGTPFKLLPATITTLYEEKRYSPWGFAGSLAFCFGASVSTLGSYYHLKLTLLMSLVLLRENEKGKLKGERRCLDRLHVLAVGSDILLLQRLLRYGAAMADRFITFQPPSDLFASPAQDSFGSGSYFIHAGCIPLAQNGVCLIQNMAQLRKEQKERLQNVMEYKEMTIDIPKKQSLSQQQQTVLPLKSTIWACAEMEHKTNAMANDFSPVRKETRAVPKALTDRFDISYFFEEHLSCNKSELDRLSLATLKRATNDEAEDVFISDDEMFQYLQYARSQEVTLTRAAQDLIQSFYIASRRARCFDSQPGSGGIPLTAVQTITSMAAAHARLSLRQEVLEEDAVLAIMMYEESITARCGFSILGTPKQDIFVNPDQTHDEMMKDFHRQLKRFCETFSFDAGKIVGRFREE